jgi:hypothetical protein
VPIADSQPVGPSPRSHGAAALAELTGGVRDFGRRRALITVVGSLATGALLAFLLAGRRHEFAAALSGPAVWVLAVTALLQIVALLAAASGGI